MASDRWRRRDWRDWRGAHDGPWHGPSRGTRPSRDRGPGLGGSSPQSGLPPAAEGRAVPGPLPTLAVVIPALNEAEHLPLLLADLAAAPGLVAELLVVDGGSRDGTVAMARLAGARVTQASGGRGAQLAQGARQTTAPWLLFLHGDTRLPRGWTDAVTRALAQAQSQSQSQTGAPVGWYFQLGIEAAGPGLRLLQVGVALRSRWLQRPYGDQGLLVRRDAYLAAGGFRPLPLMEDLDLVERLAGRRLLRCLGPGLLVAGRRGRRLGLWGCLWQNWRLRQAWRRGVGAEALAQRYYGH